MAAFQMIDFPYAEETIKSAIHRFERRGFVLHLVQINMVRQDQDISIKPMHNLSCIYNIRKYGLLAGKLLFRFSYLEKRLNCSFTCEDVNNDKVFHKTTDFTRPSGKRYGILASKKLLEHCQKTIFSDQIHTYWLANHGNKGS